MLARSYAHHRFLKGGKCHVLYNNRALGYGDCESSYGRHHVFLYKPILFALCAMVGSCAIATALILSHTLGYKEASEDVVG